VCWQVVTLFGDLPNQPPEETMQRIAISGKGGSGKTTISGTLARLTGRRLGRVLAVDGDPNPNLGRAMGVQHDGAWPLLPTNLMKVEEIVLVTARAWLLPALLLDYVPRT
jgi:cellulose biosynthesis protein BcsQ